MSNQLPLAQETPLKPKYSVTEAYRLGDLNEARSTVIEDLGEWVPEIPFDVFVHRLLPKVAGFDPSATVEALKVAGSLVLDQERDVWSWSAFESEPKDSVYREADAFKPLETVHEQICRKAFPGKIPQPIPNTEYLVWRLHAHEWR